MASGLVAMLAPDCPIARFPDCLIACRILGKTASDLVAMLELLEGKGDDDDEGGACAPDEMVLCRLCEEQLDCPIARSPDCLIA
eukprot:4042752-Prymnesium_polylepis.1